MCLFKAIRRVMRLLIMALIGIVFLDIYDGARSFAAEYDLSSSRRIVRSDSCGQKVEFIKSSVSRSERIELLSSKQFKFRDEVQSIGKKGVNLKEVMAMNPMAVSMVEEAYQKHRTGGMLIGLGLIVAIAGIALPVEIGETDTRIYYWFPVVTLGTIIGGIGISKQSSLTKDLQRAVERFNHDLIMDLSD